MGGRSRRAHPSCAASITWPGLLTEATTPRRERVVLAVDLADVATEQVEPVTGRYRRAGRRRAR
jgi:hypothetical protein